MAQGPHFILGHILDNLSGGYMTCTGAPEVWYSNPVVRSQWGQNVQQKRVFGTYYANHRYRLSEEVDASSFKRQLFEELEASASFPPEDNYPRVTILEGDQITSQAINASTGGVLVLRGALVHIPHDVVFSGLLIVESSNVEIGGGRGPDLRGKMLLIAGEHAFDDVLRIAIYTGKVTPQVPFELEPRDCVFGFDTGRDWYWAAEHIPTWQTVSFDAGTIVTIAKRTHVENIFCRGAHRGYMVSNNYVWLGLYRVENTTPVELLCYGFNNDKTPVEDNIIYCDGDVVLEPGERYMFLLVPDSYAYRVYLREGFDIERFIDDYPVIENIVVPDEGAEHTWSYKAVEDVEGRGRYGKEFLTNVLGVAPGVVTAGGFAGTFTKPYINIFGINYSRSTPPSS